MSLPAHYQSHDQNSSFHGWWIAAFLEDEYEEKWDEETEEAENDVAGASETAVSRTRWLELYVIQWLYVILRDLH